MEPREDERQEPGVDRFLRPVFEDSLLWPIAGVTLLSLATFGAGLLLLAFVSRNGFALAALVVVGWMSADVVVRDVRQRRFGPASALVVGLWALAGVGAAAAAWWGLY